MTDRPPFVAFTRASPAPLIPRRRQKETNFFHGLHIDEEKEDRLLLLPRRTSSGLAGVGKAATSPLSAKLKTPNSPVPVEAAEDENPRSIAELLLPPKPVVLLVLLPTPAPLLRPPGSGLVHDVEEEEAREDEATEEKEEEEEDGEGGAKGRAPQEAGKGESRLRDSAALRTPSKRKSTLEMED